MFHSKNWETVSEIIRLENPWLTVVGERLLDDQGRLLDYWRVEKPHSAIAITLCGEDLIFPKPSYRPGVKCCTLDFPGGRVPTGTAPQDVIPQILQRELGLVADDILSLEPLNHRHHHPKQGFFINSSFSNQQLHGFVARIRGDAKSLDPSKLHVKRFSSVLSKGEIPSLLSELTCLQCRSLLLEWLLLQSQDI